MNVNKKFGRLRHWAGEKMGGEVRTNTTDEFKALESEMQLRADGMEQLHKTMTTYVKTLSKRTEMDDGEKMTPIAQLSATAISHGEDFEAGSEYGQCLVDFGRANEQIARLQEAYVAAASASWLDGLQRSLAQMKEYQAARKKLESRRLAFDTSQTKLQKAKKDDFRMEEDLRSQRAKYEESSDDVHRRMLDIKEAEADSIVDLTAFLDAELAYHDRARQVLLGLRQDWPAASRPPPTHPRIVSATQPSLADSAAAHRQQQPRPGLARHSTVSGVPMTANTPFSSSFPATIERPRVVRAPYARDPSPDSLPPLTRHATATSISSASAASSSSTSSSSMQHRSSLATKPTTTFDNDRGPDGGPVAAAPLRPVRLGPNVLAATPLTTPSSAAGRHSAAAHGAENVFADGACDVDQVREQRAGAARKLAPPPPPPSRSKKPPAPAPPLKRAALSEGVVTRS